MIHFAGLKAVGESVEQPLRVLREQPRLDLLAACARCSRHGVRPARLLVVRHGLRRPTRRCRAPRTCPISATNPYGRTKVMQEQILRDVAAADPSWRIALLRYFNPVGAHASRPHR